jgi:hypothetical protein
MDNCICLWGGLSLEGEINLKINKEMQYSCKFYQIIEGIIWNKEITKQFKRTICKVYFKQC